MNRRRSRVVAAAALATIGVATGPAPEVGAAPPSEPPALLELPRGLDVFVEYPRYLHLWREVDVAFDNQSASDVRVVDLRLDTPLFATMPPDEPDYVVRAGLRQDLAAALGRARCEPSAAPSYVEATVDIDGDVRHGIVEIDPEPLERVNAAECAERRVLDTVDITIGPDFTDRDRGVTTSLTLVRRAGADPLQLTHIRGSVILNVAATTSDPVAVLDADHPSVSVPIDIVVGRCDPHAAIESKSTFRLEMWVAIGDDEPVHVVVELDGEVRARLDEILDRCIAEAAAEGRTESTAP